MNMPDVGSLRNPGGNGSGAYCKGVRMNDGDTLLSNHPYQPCHRSNELKKMGKYAAWLEVASAHYRQGTKLKPNAESLQLRRKTTLTPAIFRQDHERRKPASVQTFYRFKKNDVGAIKVIAVMNKKNSAGVLRLGHIAVPRIKSNESGAVMRHE